MAPRAAASIIDIETDIRPRFIQRHGKPVLGVESDGITLPLLLDPESRHDLRGLVGLTELHQARITRDQSDSNERFIGPGPIKSSEIRQLAMMGDSVVLDFGRFGPVQVFRIEFIEGHAALGDINQEEPVFVADGVWRPAHSRFHWRRADRLIDEMMPLS